MQCLCVSKENNQYIYNEKYRPAKHRTLRCDYCRCVHRDIDAETIYRAALVCVCVRECVSVSDWVSVVCEWVSVNDWVSVCVCVSVGDMVIFHIVISLACEIADTRYYRAWVGVGKRETLCTSIWWFLNRACMREREPGSTNNRNNILSNILKN